MNSSDPSDTGFKKRTATRPQRDRQGFSGEMREIRDAVQRAEPEAALQAIEDVLLHKPLAQEVQGQVLALAADSEFKRGAFEEAVEIHEAAIDMTADDPILWLRPHIGKIRSLLKAAHIEQAWEEARVTYAAAQAKWQEFNQGARHAKTILKRGRRIVVTPRPQRVSVVAGELGRLFLREGEIDAAKEFLSAAIEACPKGATRARESLAEIALREGKPQEALEWAMQALMVGRFQAKTLHTLRLLVKIKHQLGDPRVSPEVLALVNRAQPGISARATVILIQELRAIGDQLQWRELGRQWLARHERTFPIEAAEIRKMILRECKQHAGDPSTSIAAAKAVLNTPKVSPMEWLSAAKEVVRATWWSGHVPDMAGLVSQAEALYSKEHAQDVAHSLGLSTIMAKRHAEAITWLEHQRQSMVPGTPVWGKVTWALAVACYDTKQPVKAAEYEDQFAKETSHPTNLRAQARLKWIRHLIEAGDTSALAAGLAEVKALLPQVEDWSTLLDIGRQLCHVPGDGVSELKDAYFDKAEQLGLAAVNGTEHPSVATGILLKMARRFTYDASRPESTIKLWETIGEEGLQWLWSEKADFWEWVGLVMLSYLSTGKIDQADAIHAHHANDAGTPVAGKVVLHILYGNWAMKTLSADHKQTGLALLSRALDLDPSHDWCRYANYWWAMEYWNAGDVKQAKANAIKVRIPTWNNSGMLDDWEMAARAEWILANGEEARLDSIACGKFEREFLLGMKP